jgi:hypothetical protein
VEDLLTTLETTSHEAETQTKQHVGKDGTQDSSSNNGDILVSACDQQHHEEDDFNDRSKCRLGNDAEHLGQFTSEF